ncbi:MAG: DNA-directed DNA polymerase II small subunit [Candidatus Micrarchaeota archaeon]
MDLLEVARQRKMLLEAGVLEKLSPLPQAQALEVLLQAEKQAEEKKLFVISNELVQEIISSKAEEKKTTQAMVEVEKPPEEQPVAFDDDFKHSLKILSRKKYDCSGGVNDFVSHFRNRLEKLTAILRNRASTNGVTQIEQVKSSLDKRRSRVIGMVESKNVTKKGNFRFQLEDETGAVTCIATQGKPSMEKAQELWLDEVVAVDGYYYNGFFIVDDITWPEVPIRPKKLAGVEKDVSIAFMSDLHVGSKFFMQDEFERALGFYNGTGGDEEREIAKTVKYLLIAGDVVDGVGVYPSQEKQLVTKSIFEQYELLSEFLKKIPSRIQVVICPGNHDAVRDAEPQPALQSEFTYPFKQENFHFVPNPCWVEIHGLKTLMYHGTSFDAMVSNSQKFGDAAEHPEKVAVEMLRRRHLSPTFGENPILPSPEDGMVIEDAPDFFHFGHVHKNAYWEYNGTVIINSGTWQGETDYQKSLGRKPSPCLLPVYNIRTGKVKILDYSEGK